MGVLWAALWLGAGLEWDAAPRGALDTRPQRPPLCPAQPAPAFTVKQGVHVSGASPESVSGLLSEVAECGTHYARLSHFSLQPVLDASCSEGLVFQVRPRLTLLQACLRAVRRSRTRASEHKQCSPR